MKESTKDWIVRASFGIPILFGFLAVLAYLYISLWTSAPFVAMWIFGAEEGPDPLRRTVISTPHDYSTPIIPIMIKFAEDHGFKYSVYAQSAPIFGRMRIDGPGFSIDSDIYGGVAKYEVSFWPNGTKRNHPDIPLATIDALIEDLRARLAKYPGATLEIIK